jgi:hypothetical protein
LLRSVILEYAAEINSKLQEDEDHIEDMHRDHSTDMGDSLASEICDDKDEIKSEEMYDEAEEGHEGEFEVHGDENSEDHEAGEELAADMDADKDLTLGDVEHEEKVEDRVDHVEDELKDLEDDFDKLAAEFDRLAREEEKEHDVDFNDDGEIEGHEDEKVNDKGEGEGHIEESVELHKVNVDMKDKTPGTKDKSPVATNRDKVGLGGEAVKTKGPVHKDFNREDKKVGTVTKHTNTVDSGKDALGKPEAKKGGGAKNPPLIASAVPTQKK